MRKFLILLPIGLSAIFSLFYFRSPKKFTVTKVVDGDTIKLDDGRSVRYINIDVPESEECFSQEAKTINEKLVGDKLVRLETDINEMDRFGRTLAYVYVQEEGGQEIFVNQYLLQEGVGEFFLDTVNLRYQDLLIQAAEGAHEGGKGLWRTCAPSSKVGCQVKGNLDKWDHRWYHLPSFRHYDQIVINLEHGDRWFCSEEQAQTAGFVSARE